MTYLVGEDVTLAAFDGWQDYDVIHVYSHGTRNSFTMGAEVNRGDGGVGEGAPGPETRRRSVACERLGHGGCSAPVGVVRRSPLLPSALSPRSGSDAHLCGCLQHVGSPRRADTASGRPVARRGVHVRWLGRHFVHRHGRRAHLLLQPLESGVDRAGSDPSTPRGSPAWESMETPSSRTSRHAKKPRDRPGAVRRGWLLGTRGSDMRIREVARLVHPAGDLFGDGIGQEWQPARVGDGDDIESLIEGLPGDEEADFLRVMVEVDAIRPRQSDSTDVYLELDGKRIGDPMKLSQGEVRLVSNSDGMFDTPAYRVLFDRVPVGKDLEPFNEFELEAVVRLPEGGESRYSARLLSCGGPTPGARPEDCNSRFTLRAGGEATGTQEGWIWVGTRTASGAEPGGEMCHAVIHLRTGVTWHRPHGPDRHAHVRFGHRCGRRSPGGHVTTWRTTGRA